MKPKLTREQYEMVESQFFRTPDTRRGDYDLAASGEHYFLIHILGLVGVRVYSREEALTMAEKIADGEYERNDW
jgi:hypothetical protein